MKRLICRVFGHQRFPYRVITGDDRVDAIHRHKWSCSRCWKDLPS